MHYWFYILLIGLAVPASVLSTGGETAGKTCEDVLDRVSGNQFVLDEEVLQMVGIQDILDCLLAHTIMRVTVSEIPTEGGIILRKPIKILSNDNAGKLECSEEGLQIRSDEIRITGLKIKECERSSSKGMINVENAKDVSFQNIECYESKNDKGPACISLSGATATFWNFTGDRNQGVRGGVLCVEDSSVNLQNCEFHMNNVVTIEEDGKGRGGVIHSQVSSLAVWDTKFEHNNAQDSGGCIFSYKGDVVISGGNLKYNSAGNLGGGVFSEKGSLSVSHSSFEHNEASGHGGAMFSYKGEVGLSSSKLVSNHAQGLGGGLLSEKGELEVSDCIFSGNKAEKHGGGLGSYKGEAEVTRAKFSGNSAGGIGGGVFSEKGELHLWDSTFDDNDALMYGGGAGSYKGELHVSGCLFANNTASEHGGGVYSEKAELQISGASLTDNTAKKLGGGIFSYKGELTAAKCDISGNTAGQVGGGLSSLKALLQVSGCDFKKNSAAKAGGGLFAECYNDLECSLSSSVFKLNKAPIGSKTFYKKCHSKDSLEGFSQVEDKDATMAIS